MTKKITASEALQFFIDNDLDEVISDKEQNLFLEPSRHPCPELAKGEDLRSFVSEPKTHEILGSLARPRMTDTKKSAAQFFSKPVLSTNDALSNLAKKSQLPENKILSDEKFQSLNEIVAKAKKAAQAAKTLDELRKAVENFDGCNLKKMATNTVFSDGHPNSKVMVIGEAPGNHEDLQGIPFCGDSGKVLDDMFRAINMTRADNFYITNVIFWRPPGNRRPTDEELAICRPFVERHIQLLNPEVLVLVGATSMTALLGINEPIGQIRGKFMDFAPKFLSRPIKTFTIFHPSYLMRQSAKKRVAWQDMLALEKFLN